MTQPRYTLRELAAAANAAGPDPWACRRCGCKDWRVVDSRMATGERKRKRVCRHCGQGFIDTSEVPVPEGHKIKVVPADEDEEIHAA
jgi:transcriptional regulator NrdR family protein